MNLDFFNDIMGTSFGAVSVGSIISAILTLVVCIIVVKIVLRVAKKLLDKSKLDSHIVSLVTKILKILLYVLAAMITVSALGIDTSSMVALVSVFSLGITLAVEDIMANIASGNILLTTRPFIEGDFITINGVDGTVVEVRLNNTRLKTVDGTLIVIPNKEVASSKIINYTTNGTRRIDIDFSASYDAPTEAVKNAALAAAASCSTTLTDPAPVCYLFNYGDSAIEYKLILWCKAPDFFGTKMAVNEAIRAEFDKANLEMTYNHLNVHIIDQK